MSSIMDQAALQHTIPAGFTEMNPYGPFHELVGPLYETVRGDRIVIGMRVSEKHRNAGPMMHGGMFLTLADNAMTHAASQQRPADSGCVTTAISGEFMSAARIGDWIEAEVEVLKSGRKVVFLNCVIRRDGSAGEVLMRASSTFQIIPPRK